MKVLQYSIIKLQLNMLDPSNILNLTLFGPPAAKLLIPKGSLAADLGPRFSTGAAVEGGGAAVGCVRLRSSMTIFLILIL